MRRKQLLHSEESVFGCQTQPNLSAPIGELRQNCWKLYPILFVAILLVGCSELEEPIIEPTQNPPHVQQDTTGHDVKWEIHVLGKEGLSTSLIRDIYALNDTDVWIVGSIFIDAEPDSIGFAYSHFNSARWNGKVWEYFNINADRYSLTSKGAGRRRFIELFCLWVFGHNDLVAQSDGGDLQWYDEKRTKWGYDQNVGEWGVIKYWKESFTNESRRGMNNKMWAYSKNDIYFCGDNGSVTRRINGNFKRVETGSNVRLNDIYGNDKHQLWTGGYDNFGGDWRAFIKIENEGADDVIMKNYSGERAHAHTIYISGDTLYANVGDAILVQSTVDPSHFRYTVTKETFNFMGLIECIRGRGNNNIYAAGAYGTILHYNGRSWMMVNEPSLTSDYRFFDIAMTHNHVYISGMNRYTNQAVVFIGTLMPIK